MLSGMPPDGYFIGNEAIAKRGILAVRRPISLRTITNFDDMERLWRHAYTHELHVQPPDQPVLMTDAQHNQTRETIAQIAFESLGVPALNISNQAVLAAYGVGLTTALVVDSGESSTHIVPVVQGRPVKDAAERLDIGNRDFVNRFMRELSDEGSFHVGGAMYQVNRDILTKTGYVALDYGREVEAPSRPPSVPDTYELPDGEVIRIGKASFSSPEILFKPWLAGIQEPAIQNLIHESIASLDTDVQEELYSHIVLAGGNTMLPGFVERLKKELVAGPPDGIKRVDVIAPSDLATWLGGSILSSLSIFKNLLVTKAEYDEVGESGAVARWI